VRKRMLRNIFDVMLNVIKWNKFLSLLSKRIYNVDEIIEYDFIVDDDYQYLLKGGQRAKKNASEYIRCYG